MRRFAALVVGVVLLSACAQQDPVDPTASDTVSPTTNPTLAPSPNALADAIEATAARGTAQVSVTIDSPSQTVNGTGSTSLTSPKGSIRWESTDEGVGTWTELLTRTGLYSLIDDTWFLAPAGTFTPTSAALTPLDGLNQLDADPAAPLAGTLPLTIESGLNFSEEDLVNLPQECPAEITVSLEVDAAGIINQITKEFICPDYDRYSVTKLTEFGTAITVTEPTDAIEVPGNQ